MSSKEDVFEGLTQLTLNFLERFKFIEKAIESLCKTLSKKSVSEEEFEEILKLYNTTGSMFLKALDLLNNILSRFPEELSPEEVEVIDYYRKLTEADKYVYRAKLKELSRNGIR